MLSEFLLYVSTAQYWATALSTLSTTIIIAVSVAISVSVSVRYGFRGLAVPASLMIWLFLNSLHPVIGLQKAVSQQPLEPLSALRTAAFTAFMISIFYFEYLGALRRKGTVRNAKLTLASFAFLLIGGGLTFLSHATFLYAVDAPMSWWFFEAAVGLVLTNSGIALAISSKN